jgi:hypothetical protein
MHTPSSNFPKPVGNLVLKPGTRVIAGCAFGNCDGLTGTLNIPNSVISINISAFESCSGFTGAVNIPDSVTDIGMKAFK